jgi:hypothetical protein
MRVRAAALGVALVVLAGAGCSGGSMSGMSKEAKQSLQLQAAAVRQSAESGDLAKANDYLTQLTTSVTTLRSEGKLTDAAATQILAAARSVTSQLGAAAPSTTKPTTTTTTAPPPTEPPKPPKGHDKGKGD